MALCSVLALEVMAEGTRYLGSQPEIHATGEEGGV